MRGYAANPVVAQTPAAGTHVLDTGAPTIMLRLVASGAYPQRGAPEDDSPYRGTAIRLATAVADCRDEPAAKPAASRRRSRSEAEAAAKPRRSAAAEAARRAPPAFVVSGAPKEPLDEITLSARALRTGRLARAARRRRRANVQHWLYQHAWIVTGARFGWSHGAEALQTLIGVDERVQRQWGIGSQSEAVARAALAQARRHSR